MSWWTLRGTRVDVKVCVLDAGCALFVVYTISTWPNAFFASACVLPVSFGTSISAIVALFPRNEDWEIFVAHPALERGLLPYVGTGWTGFDALAG
jgi:hypothetical protein